MKNEKNLLNTNDFEVLAALAGSATAAFGDAGYQGIEKRADAKTDTTNIKWHNAMRRGKRKTLNKDNEADALTDKAEKLKAGIRAKMEHPFQVIKHKFEICKGKLSRFEEEQAAVDHVVCAVQSVDGEGKADGV